jgi:four helix bundle protein
MAGFKSFREFAAWQLAFQLRRAVIPLCVRIRDEKDFEFLRQLREAARSGPRNIAEGFGRFKHKDFAKFVRIAKASELELLNHFEEAEVSGYVTPKQREELEHLARKAIKAANGLIRYLESTPDPCTKAPKHQQGTKAPAP